MFFISPLHLSPTDTNHIDTVSLNTALKKQNKKTIGKTVLLIITENDW